MSALMRAGAKSVELVVVSPEQLDSPEIPLVKDMLDSGLFRFHLRKPGADRDDLVHYLQQFSPEHLTRISVHGIGSWELDCSGVHLQESDWRNLSGDKTMLKELRSKGAKSVSASIHNQEDLLNYGKYFDYIFFGPVFTSISKQGYQPRYLEAELEHMFSMSEANIFPIGGISKNNFAILKNWKIRGVAVLGTIWMSADPLKEFEEVQRLCQQN